jgi:hypothetical protein
MRTAAANLFVAAFVALSSEALAEPAPSPSDPRYFPVALDPTLPNVKVEVTRISERAVAGTCAGSCSLPLGPGRYMIRVTEESGKASQEAVTIIESQRLALQPPNRDAKYGGLALGIFGTTFASVGGVLTLACLAHHSCPDSNDRYPYLFPAVVSMAIAGAIAAPIGWVIFGRNRKLRIEPGPYVRPPDNVPASTPQLSVGLVQVRGGMLAAGGIAF